MIGSLLLLRPIRIWHIRAGPPAVEAPSLRRKIFGESLFGSHGEAVAGTPGIESVSVVAGTGAFGPKLAQVLERLFRRIVTERSYERWPTAQQEVYPAKALKGVRNCFFDDRGLTPMSSGDVRHFLDFHRSTGGSSHAASQRCQGPLDLWAAWNPSGLVQRRLAAHFRFGTGEFPGLPVPCPIDGYVNRLASAGDLRRLGAGTAFFAAVKSGPGGGENLSPVSGWRTVCSSPQAQLSLSRAPFTLGSSTNIGGRPPVVTRFKQHLNIIPKWGDGNDCGRFPTVLPFTELAKRVGNLSFRGGRQHVGWDVRRNLALYIRGSQV